MTISKEQIKNELLTKGIRPSHQRIRILEYLRVMENHPTADEIFEKLCGEILTLSKTTVYNTMHAFVEGNLARVIRIDGIEQRFDATLHSHGHFKCDSCEKIFNFQIDMDQFIADGLNQYQIREKNVFFNGLCPNCLNIQKKGKV
jgi:Fur family peroxide stress response transcriptional regulator